MHARANFTIDLGAFPRDRKLAALRPSINFHIFYKKIRLGFIRLFTETFPSSMECNAFEYILFNASLSNLTKLNVPINRLNCLHRANLFSRSTIVGRGIRTPWAHSVVRAVRVSILPGNKPIKVGQLQPTYGRSNQSPYETKIKTESKTVPTEKGKKVSATFAQSINQPSNNTGSEQTLRHILVLYHFANLSYHGVSFFISS